MAEIFQVSIKSGEVLKGYYFPAEIPQCNLTVITGMDEYAFRYREFAEWMNRQNINVWVLDAFGQGLNAESVDKQEIWPKDAYAKQVGAIRKMTQLAKGNGLPTFLMGHSMGSFMVQSYLQHYPESVSGTIICGSNGGQAALMKLGYTLAKVLVSDKNWEEKSPILQKLGLGGYTTAIKDRKTDFDWLSYNRENVSAYIADPWCGHENTAGFWREFLKGMSTVWDKNCMQKVSGNEHVLLIAGAEDPVGQNGKGVLWLADAYKALGMKDVVTEIYPNMRHEILKEDEREKVFADIVAFIKGIVVQ